MTFRHLEIFISVAENLNMSLAAERLFIAQSSVSQAVAELERSLKTRLFERFGRRLHLTESGIELLSYARHIMSLKNDLQRTMLDRQRGGSIRIGGTMTVGSTVLFPLLRKFRDIMPGCDIFFTVDNTMKLEKALLEDKIDLALSEGRMKSPHLASRDVMDDELLLVCSASHRFSGRDYIERSELSGERFIIREEGSGTRELFESVMSAGGIGYEVNGVLNNGEAIKKGGC